MLDIGGRKLDIRGKKLEVERLSIVSDKNVEDNVSYGHNLRRVLQN